MASFLAPVFKDAGTPLAAWLTVLLTLIGLLLVYRQQQQAQPVITPQQVEEIVTRAVDELEIEPAEPEPKPKTPDKPHERRSHR